MLAQISSVAFHDLLVSIRERSSILILGMAKEISSLQYRCTRRIIATKYFGETFCFLVVDSIGLS